VDLFVYNNSFNSPPPSYVWPLAAYLSASSLTPHERTTVGTAVRMLQDLLGDTKLVAAASPPADDTLCYLEAGGAPVSLSKSIDATLNHVPPPKAPTKTQLHEFQALVQLVEKQLAPGGPALTNPTLPQLAKTLYHERAVPRTTAATLDMLEVVDRDVIEIADHFSGEVDRKTFAAALAIRMMIDQAYESLLVDIRAQSRRAGGDAL
jgi:hypothetical protein